MEIEFKDGRSKESGYLKLYKFEDVDPEFIKFIKEHIQSEDMWQSSDFFILED